MIYHVCNIWTETDDMRTDMLNIVKSFLCNSTNGETAMITDVILGFSIAEIEEKGYVYEFPERQFDAILGFKHDYKVDDPLLDGIAETVLNGLLMLNKDIEEHPENYFTPKSECSVCNAPPHVACELCVGEGNVCTNSGCCPFKGKFGKRGNS